MDLNLAGPNTAAYARRNFFGRRLTEGEGSALGFLVTCGFKSLIAFALTGALVACSDAPAPAGKASAPVTASPASKPSPTDPAQANRPSDREVKLNPELELKIKVHEVREEAVAETLAVAGRIDFNEQAMARIGTAVTGRALELKASVGQRVRAGQVLATMNSSELSTAQLNYLKTVAQARLLVTSAERARQLYASDVISLAEMQRRENASEIAHAEESGAASQLQILGMNPQAIAELQRTNVISPVKTIVSRTDGTVVERSVAVGQVVQPADTMFVVADLSRVWVVADVPEQQSASIQLGQQVEIEVPSLDRTLTGRIVHVASFVDPQTRTVMARCELDNRSGELKPAMLANLLIQTSRRRELVVPASGVLRENNRDHVYVQKSAGVFVLTPVELGPAADGDLRPVRSGLSPGQRIVIDGAFHLNNERLRNTQS